MRKERDNYTRIRISVPQFLGIFLMCAGIIIIIAAGAGAYKNATDSLTENNEKYLAEDIEATLSEEEAFGNDEDAWADSQEQVRDSKSSMSVMPLLLLGGIMILASVPLFYTSYTDKGLWLRLRTKHEYDDSLNDDEEYIDDEFDYPTDDYEYILDDEIRARLIAERDRKIKEKLKQRRKMMKRKKRRKL